MLRSKCCQTRSRTIRRRSPASSARRKQSPTLTHPNILAIHDFGSDGGVSYAVTELLDGDTLRARMDGSPLPMRKAVEYGVQIVRGIAAAHQKGIVHRDLKTENISITRDGQVKVLDFGLAKAVGDATVQGEPRLADGTAPGVVMGTVGYMSPEQVRGLAVDQQHPGARVDAIGPRGLVHRRRTRVRARVARGHLVWRSAHVDSTPGTLMLGDIGKDSTVLLVLGWRHGARDGVAPTMTHKYGKI